MIPGSTRIESAMIARLVWPDRQVGDREVDCFWIEATAEEAEESIMPHMTKQERRNYSLQKDHHRSRPKGEPGIPGSRVFFLVSRDGEYISFEPWYMPYSGLWNAYCPFVRIKPVSVQALGQLRDVAYGVDERE